MEVKIRGIDEKIIKEIDKIADRDKLSRNALIVKILSDYVACKDEFLSNSLPKITKSLVENELKRLTLTADCVTENVYIATLKMMKSAEKIEIFFTSDSDFSQKK
ncbi:MAG: hypothetical protein LUI06_04900 [Ruminococcus sp.]|nr:hypothetical protein [Ruminococcus sp.]